jgi:hypothetical protein
VTFKLYDASIGGITLSTDTHSVTAANGLFTTSIAVTNPAVVDGRALWLGIKVGSDPEMTPRQEIRPVPYALGLRPGAWITGLTENSQSLNLENSGYNGRGLNVSVSGSEGRGVSVLATGMGGIGVNAVATSLGGRGIYASSMGSNGNGVTAYTRGDASRGLTAETHGKYSIGMYIVTRNISSPGMYVRTTDQQSNGMNVSTVGYNSDGVRVVTTNGLSEGVVASTSGEDSAALCGSAYGPGSYGVQAYSSSDSAVWADTDRADHMYGVQTPDYIRAARYDTGASDLAEYMPVDRDAAPGTVLVIGPEGKLRPSESAYDTRVIGIVSTEPGVTLGTHGDGNYGEALVAVAGQVPCRVDAGYGAISPGDLLSTSDTPGHAMKAEPTIISGRGFYPDGTILGKAMGTLGSGTGTIEVLVTLQ